MKSIKLLAGAAVLSLLAACAGHVAGVKTADTAKGTVLTDAKGMTLYTFDKDVAGKSNCTGQCAQNWPPFKADAGTQPTTDWTMVKRDDGALQWAYKSKPVYGWVKDQKPGDVTGDGVGGAWRVARP